MSTSATPEPVIRQIVEAMRALAGPHPGFRPVHARGLVCSGAFRASADASRVSRAPHFTGQSVATTVRFANSNGNPDVHDGVPNVRSIAVKFQLADGKNADILANSVEGFIARTPEELLEFLRAQLPEPATGLPDEQRLIFDPTNRTDGIDLSADPILLARPAAYVISYDRRSKGE